MSEAAADHVVLAPDRPEVSLVAAIRLLDRARLGAAEEQLERYMLGRLCPIGLLVTPDLTRIYRDTFLDFTADSIEQVAEIASVELLGRAAVAPVELDHMVFDWLERLALSWPAALPEGHEARAVVTEHLVPAVVQGRVRRQIRAA